MSDLTLKSFEPLVGNTFDVTALDTGTVRLRLSQVEALHGKHSQDLGGQPAQEGFSLVFEGGTDTPLHQGLYTFVHPGLGECAHLFMPPVVCPNAGARHYQVLFNRPIAK